MDFLSEIAIFWSKSTSWFDIWSIEHFVAWMSFWVLTMGIHSHIYKKKKWFHPEEIVTRYFDIILILCIAYFWETLEHYLELWILGEAVKHWFYGVEFIWNRMITDPVLMVLGYLFIRKYNNLVWFARFFSVIWLTVHIFVFPHSMYLQEILFP